MAGHRNKGGRSALAAVDMVLMPPMMGNQAKGSCTILNCSCQYFLHVTGWRIHIRMDSDINRSNPISYCL
eukprot:scaffold22595_cov102-Cylindrotheca_fusiformis.AAC.5